MKIGIIGVGAIGGHLARSLAAKGHEVRVANSRGADAVREFAKAAGASATDVSGAVDGVDAVIISIPFSAIAKLPRGLFANLREGVPVIDTGNYYPVLRDPPVEEIEAGKTESVWVAEQLGRPIIKAFNSIFAASLAEKGKPAGARNRVALAVAGDTPEEKRVAMGLVDQVGFDPLDAGSLQDSWRQQPNTPAYCTDYGLSDLRRALASAVEGAAPAKRAEFVANIQKIFAENPTNDERVALARRETPITA
ncbi:3-hydroxyisobutyrate dehydrogenase [Kaistia sp. 32K]|uniref:NADPH-dependent F420 reductase n=1 Tax=Kaistia sp. 32K TaxID=2795690 RepID=UPI001915177F|nr:NAD(P)-binding domain-containing protein [Kaistia sp. 32K]BCP52279.1 3-hydroxyisobutyrate dehydrogenase [Kaistia sp. 32K]